MIFSSSWVRRCVVGGALFVAGLGALFAQTDGLAPGASLRLLNPETVELQFIEVKPPGEAARWTQVTPADAVVVPSPDRFEVTVDGRRRGVAEVGLKRRAIHAPLAKRDLRVAVWIILKLEQAVDDGATVAVSNPAADLWGADVKFRAVMDPLRTSPAIHVNQEGYVPAMPKIAMVGYYLGSAGELAIPADRGFKIISPAGATVYEGKLVRRADDGYTYRPPPYQQVFAADFSALTRPGTYRLVVPGLGASLPFRIDEGIAADFLRTYALGIYHQRCGTENALPYTRFVHGACHTAPAEIPLPADAFAFTWGKLAQLAAEGKSPRAAGPPLGGEAAQLYPFIRRGRVDVAGGHHDAGDYSKYTINSAAFIHTLLFAVDSLPGAAEWDNLGLPESGDGVSDLLQEAKWEIDFLAKLQDEDGGFYFLVYPRDRPYEHDVLPDRGDPQVVWPKNTAATAAAVAALAQASSSPRFRQHYPEVAAACLRQAELGWKFLAAALARHGQDGAYQRLTHYGDDFLHDDELAWAACELFLATGDEAYHRQFREWCDPASPGTRRWGWGRLSESWGNAIRSYAFGARSGRVAAGKLDRAMRESCEREIEAAARDAALWSQHSAYGTSFPDPTKRMRGAGWYFSLDQAFALAVGCALDYPERNDPRAEFLAAYCANLNYEAGTNPLNQSFITGLGERRPREIVHQYAQNDRRTSPPSGLPIGNVQAGPPYLGPYQGELGALSYPADGAAGAPYPFYDRWTDTHNVATEFVIVNQARALAGLAWLAARTGASRRNVPSATGSIAGVPAKVKLHERVTARFVPPPGYPGAPVRVSWEARRQEPGRGDSYTFAAGAHGVNWIEAEAQWGDGRRAFATAEFFADNGLASVSVTAPVAQASVADRVDGVFEFKRTGDLARPLTVKFELKGTAGKWNDYRRPEGDMPVEITIPAGASSVRMAIRPVPGGLGANSRHVLLVLAASENYNVVKPNGAVIALVGADAPPPGDPPPIPPLPQ